MVEKVRGKPDPALSSTDVSNHVAFIAAPYGYGPVSKAVAISTYLPSSISRTFIGDGPSIALAQKSRAFNRCIRIDFTQRIEHIQECLAKFQVLVFINTTRFIGAWCKANHYVIYVDTLAWLHGEPPPNAGLAHSYVGQTFFHHPVCDQLSQMATFQQLVSSSRALS